MTFCFRRDDDNIYSVLQTLRTCCSSCLKHSGKRRATVEKTVSVLIRSTGTPPPQPSHVCWRGAGADAGGGRGGGRAGDGGPAAILIALPIRRPNHGESPRALSLEEFLRSLRSGNVCKRFSARKERRESSSPYSAISYELYQDTKK